MARRIDESVVALHTRRYIKNAIKMLPTRGVHIAKLHQYYIRVPSTTFT
jgi:hypothetical protein